jgi:hypothetical protein
LNQRHENKFDIGVWARTINEPSGTSAKHTNQTAGLNCRKEKKRKEQNRKEKKGVD